MIALLGATLEEMSLEQLQAEISSAQSKIASLMDGVDAIKLDIDSLNTQVTDIEYQISITPKEIMGSVKVCQPCWFFATCCEQVPTYVANPKIGELTAQRNEIVGRRNVKQTELTSKLKEIDSLATYQTQVQSAINDARSDYALTSGLSLSSILNPQNWPIIGALWRKPEEGVPAMAPELKKALIIGLVAVSGIIIVKRITRRPPKRKAIK